MRETTPALDACAPSSEGRADLPDPVLRALGGAPGAADRLWSDQAPRLLRAALALGVPPVEAPDVVQEVLLAAFRNLGRYRTARGSFDAWLHGILLRRCANWRRARARFLRALASLGRDGRPRPAAPDREVDARRTLDRLLGGLPPAQRRVWTLVEISGVEAVEVARLLGIREATVRSHLRHARESLRRRAEEMR